MSTTHGTTWLERTSVSTRHVASFIRKYWDAFQERRERQKLRDALSNLSDRDLLDIGITRGEIDYVTAHRGIDPRGVRSTEWVRYLPMWDGQIGPFWADFPQGSDANRNYSVAYFHLAAVLARLGELDEARAAVQAGLALDPSFTIRRYRDAISARSDIPAFLVWRERHVEGMRLAGVPEG